MNRANMIGNKVAGSYLPAKLEQIVSNPLDNESRKEYHKSPKNDLLIIKR